MRARLLPVTSVICAVLLVSKLAGLGMALLPGPVVAAAQAAPTPETPAVAAKPAAAATLPGLPAAAAAPEFSQGERQLLLDLRARRTELEDRERTLSQREGVLDAAEQQLTARVAELTSLQSRLEQLEKDRQSRDEANWAGLVKVYETMKPRDAAAIFNEIELPVLLQVLDRMKESKSAALLAAMLPDRARQATQQLAAMRIRAGAVPDHPGAG